MEKKEQKKKHKVRKIIGWCLIVLILIIVAVALRYLAAFNNFLDRITERKPEMKQYSVAVMEESPIKEVSELEGKSVGFLKTDTKASNAEQALESTVDIDADFYDDVDMMVEMLGSGITDAIALETDRLEILKEEARESLAEMRVVYAFEIELESEDMEIADKEITTEPFIVYISGSDSRNGIKATARSDVNIVAVVNPKLGKILLLSIPRDTYVQLHDTTGIKDKLTHAGVYGINMSKTTIEDFLGIKIDYTIKVSFETVIRVVDQLDGIDIESDKDMELKVEGKDKICKYVVGKQHVDGDCALRFARERKSYSTGDRHRGENQQQVITSIIGRLAGSKEYLLKIPTILDIAADSFETTFTRDNISKFIRMQLTKSIDWKVKSIGIDGTGTYAPTYSMGANRPLYVLMPSYASVENAVKSINEYLVEEEEKEEIEEGSDEKNESSEEEKDSENE